MTATIKCMLCQLVIRQHDDGEWIDAAGVSLCTRQGPHKPDPATMPKPPTPWEEPRNVGDEHYREAERLLTRGAELSAQAAGGTVRPGFHESLALIFAEAQVHATLALASATMDAACFGYSSQGAVYAMDHETRDGTGYGR